MHYAEFAEDEVSFKAGLVVDMGIGRGNENVLTSLQSAALLAAIKQYDADKWKVIGQKVGKPAKVSNVQEAYFSSLDEFG